MFSFKPNPDYVPGGVNNFWISGSSGSSGSSGKGGVPTTGCLERSRNGAGGNCEACGAAGQGMERTGGGGFGGVRTGSIANSQKDGSKKIFASKFGFHLENFAPL